MVPRWRGYRHCLSGWALGCCSRHVLMIPPRGNMSLAADTNHGIAANRNRWFTGCRKELSHFAGGIAVGWAIARATPDM